MEEPTPETTASRLVEKRKDAILLILLEQDGKYISAREIAVRLNEPWTIRKHCNGWFPSDRLYGILGELILAEEIEMIKCVTMRQKYRIRQQ